MTSELVPEDSPWFGGADQLQGWDAVELDERLGLDLCVRSRKRDLSDLVEPARVLCFTWGLEGDVANGGWAQAGFNQLDLAEAIVASYFTLGRSDLADLTERAFQAADDEQARFDADPAVGDTDEARQRTLDVMSAFDEESEAFWVPEWPRWATADRLRYAAAHHSEIWGQV